MSLTKDTKSIYITFLLIIFNRLFIKEVNIMVFGVQEITLAVIVGTLSAIVYSLRVLVLMERRIARIEGHIETAVNKVMREEARIEKSLKKKR